MTTLPPALHSFIIGRERRPSPPVGEPGKGIPADPAQALLEQLATEILVTRAAFPLRHSDVAPVATAPSDRPPCNESAAKDLTVVLAGRYSSLLPEWLRLLEQHRLAVPPEHLPLLLERALRDPAVAENIMPALGPRGTWLAQQNPRWRELAGAEETDWFTASFSDRKRLLRQTRARNPLLALAWVEKTWPEEKTEHRMQWLDVLRDRLSAADEDLLNKAMRDKSRELRRLATELAATLPGSETAAAVRAVFEERFAGMFAPGVEPAVFLQKTLPDLSEAALQPWLALLPKEQLKDWRNGLLRLMLLLTPAAELPVLCACSRNDILEKLEAPAELAALLDGSVLHRDVAWVAPVMQFLGSKNRHGLWQTGAMTGFLTLFAPEALAQMQRQNIAVGYDNQAVIRALEQYRSPWPKSLLHHFLEQYRAAAYGRGDIPGWHYASALHVAACHCTAADAAEMPFVRDYLYDPPKARPREMEDFLGIIRFRVGMQAHLQATPNRFSTP